MARITKPVKERRQEIIDTAREMFFKNGFDKTQVADISKRMNVASGLVYHYFNSKADILYAVIDQIADECLQEARVLLNSSNGTTLERLKIIFNTPPVFESLNGRKVALTLDRAVVEYWKQKMSASVMPLLTSLVEEGNADGSWNCEYPKETAVFILQGLTGVSESFAALPAPDLDKIKDTFSDIIFRVLGVPSK
ncbi:MAG: TetR/AcrR family transcriptional regulator [Clostridiales bacterium]|jgi:AcrR family transcriptional regulator|nr:TetR/AcrR family transcriptional regulator [Clostridiales bacterium]